MALIGLTTFGDGDHKYLQLGNEEWGREYSMGTNWTLLRVVALVNVVPSGTSNIPNGHLRLGVSAARDDHLGSGSAGLWYGSIACGNNTSASLVGGVWTYNAGGGEPYFSSSSHYRMRSVGGVLSGSSNAGGHYIPTTEGTPRRGILATECYKSGLNMIVGANYVTASTVDFTLSNAIELAETGFTKVLGAGFSVAGQTVNGGSTTFGAHDTNAALYGDSIAAHISWSSTVYPLRVYAVAVARIA